MSLEVICIGSPDSSKMEPGKKWKTKIGEKYSVIDHLPAKGRFCEAYEFSFDPGTCYAAKYFVRLGGPSEVALLESRVDQEIARLDEDWRQIVHEAETV